MVAADGTGTGLSAATRRHHESINGFLCVTGCDYPGSCRSATVITYTANINEARLLASLVYITIQLLTYVVIWLIGNHLLAMIYAAFLAPDSWLYLTLPPAILTLFVGIREACVLGVWRALKHRFREYTRDSRLVSDRA